MHAPLLFAAGLDWLEGLLPILFVVFWIVSQVFNAFKAVGRGRQPPVARPPRPAADAPRAEEIRAELERQIGEFLERPRPQAPRPASRQPPAARPRVGGPAPTARPARLPEPGPSPPRLPTAKPVAARPAAAVSGSDVARHVQDAFAHELEHLSSALAAGAPAPAELGRVAPPTPAAELAALLRNPTTLRQLVLLREVLERPTDRW